MATKWVTFVLVALAALAGCKKAGDGAAVSEAEVDRPPLPSAELAKLLDAVPADAAVVATLGLREPVWSQLTGGWLVPMQPELRDELDRELAAQVDQLTGLDVREARAAVVYFSDADTGGMLLHGIRGKLAGATGEHAGATIRVFPEGRPILGHLGDVLVVSGSQAELEAILDRLAGGEGGLAGELRSRIDRAREGATVAVAADIARLSSSDGGAAPMLELPPLPGKIAFASAHAGDDGLRVSVAGDDAALDAIEAQLGILATAARAGMNKERDAATDPAERMGATVASYYFENTLRHLEPERDGGELTVELPFAGEGMAANAAIVGIVGAAAIPAFMKYIKKSKTTEAQVFLRQMVQGVRAHHAEHGSLPESVGPTPAPGSCCVGGAPMCEVDPARWQHPTWQALGFSIDEPHYYAYEFARDGDRFAVRAYGDLDCDGSFSTFEATGQVQGGLIVGGDLITEADALE